MKTFIIGLFIMAIPVWLPVVVSVHAGIVLIPAWALTTYLFVREAGK